MTLRALVTGANGFVGKVLCNYLDAQGWTVFRGIGLGPTEAGERYLCDLRETDQVEGMLRWAGDLTHVFHLAAITFVPQGEENPLEAMEVNLLGTVRLLGALRPHAPKARFLFVSTAGVYGSPRWTPITEDHPLNPEEPYAVSKAAADHYCAYLAKATGMDIVRLRPFNHSGTGQSDQFVLPSLARQIAAIEAGKAEPRLMVGNLESARDFSHVDDVVRAYELAALRGNSGEAYNVCSGRSYSIRDVLEILQSLAKIRFAVEVDAARVRNVDVRNIIGSHEKLSAHTDWRPQYSIEYLLRQLLEHWRTRAVI
ncbi:MAG: GDP-mannose 4,6-dehydratase [Candidatus Hydrogenedentes bacterium]|nr:GDP-mannose 4,6-dehydratase [Candidatus Hydrogenedentota bacterium]